MNAHKGMPATGCFIHPDYAGDTTETMPEALARMLAHLLVENRTLREETKRAKGHAKQKSRHIERVREELRLARERYKGSDANSARERDYTLLEGKMESYRQRSENLYADMYALYQKEREYARGLAEKVRKLEKLEKPKKTKKTKKTEKK